MGLGMKKIFPIGIYTMESDQNIFFKNLNSIAVTELKKKKKAKKKTFF